MGQKVFPYVMMETAVLCPRGRAQLSHLLWRVLYKHELCEMGFFYRCSLYMCPDYNSQLSIHIYLKTNSNCHVPFFFFSYLGFFSVVTMTMETMYLLWKKVSFLKF